MITLNHIDNILLSVLEVFVLMANVLKWQFPPTFGGIERGFNDSGKEFFTAGIIEHVVREIIQNSLDAKDARYGSKSVVIRMNKIELKRDVINASKLMEHVSKALKSTECKNSKKGVKFYKAALEMLKKPKIPVLAVIDENTTGLDDPRWDSLVYEEGTTSKNDEAAGGSYGIGKNAPYAASGLGLVCYSTRYIDKHRVEKFIGRCKLVAHNDPKKPKTKLQDVGFGTTGDLKEDKYPPVFGSDIHKSFRLQRNGTGIFIIGFKEEQDWQETAIRSIAQSFFAAIHDKKLAVWVEDNEITNETLNQCIRSNKKYKQYYDLYRNPEPPITINSDVGGGGSSTRWKFDLKISTDGDEMKNRVAYINRRGMLITDEKRFSKNPFYPNIEMGKYVAVVCASNDATDARIREMEPPTHESIEYKRIEEQDKRQKIKEVFENVSNQIRDQIMKKLDLDKYDQTTELDELSDIIPFVADPNHNEINDKDEKSNTPKSQIGVQKKRRNNDTLQIANGGEEDIEVPPHVRSINGGGGGPGKGKTKKITTSNMKDVRVIRYDNGASANVQDGTTLRVAFHTNSGANKFVIIPIGEEYKKEPPIKITAVAGVSSAHSVKVQKDNVLRVISEPGSRVILNITSKDLPECSAYTIVEYEARRRTEK